MSDVPDELTKKVARVLHDEGMELTPQQVADLRTSALAKIRSAMRDKGYDIPDGDLELLDWMREIGL